MQRSHSRCAICQANHRVGFSAGSRSTTRITIQRTFIYAAPYLRSTTQRIWVLTTLPAVPHQQCGRQGAASVGAVRAVSSWTTQPPSSQNSSGGSKRENVSDGDQADNSTSLANVVTAAPTVLSATGQASSQCSEKQPCSPESRRTPRGASARAGGDAIGKSKRGSGSPNYVLKIKKKAPWGMQQLRDSWSEDAMSKRDRESMDERIHREYRYHPDEFRRHYIRYTAFLTIPCILLGMSFTYYCETGRPIWTADPQHLLNLLRVMDTSPRSKLYIYRLEGTEELPQHVRAYREQHKGQRAYDERVFRLTHSAFKRPGEDALRLLEMEEQLKAKEVGVAGEEGLMQMAAEVALDEE